MSIAGVKYLYKYVYKGGDVTARVFRIKCNALMKELKEVGIFGRVAAHLHVIEFQHRGLPHAHILSSAPAPSTPPSAKPTEEPHTAAGKKRVRAP